MPLVYIRNAARFQAVLYCMTSSSLEPRLVGKLLTSYPSCTPYTVLLLPLHATLAPIRKRYALASKRAIFVDVLLLSRLVLLCMKPQDLEPRLVGKLFKHCKQHTTTPCNTSKDKTTTEKRAHRTTQNTHTTKEESIHCNNSRRSTVRILQGSRFPRGKLNMQTCRTSKRYVQKLFCECTMNSYCLLHLQNMPNIQD